MRLVYLHLMAVLFIACNAFTWAQVARKDFRPDMDDERDKRAVDFGQFVRNLLLKSATASNAKANISRNVANLKIATTAAPRRRTTTTTTTTTPVPFFFNKGPFKFPFDLSGPINNKFNNNPGGFINFDYNDYGGQSPLRPNRRRRPTTTSTTTTTTTSTTTAAPATPTRRRPIPRRPYGLLGKQKVPYYDYYDDYDYNYDDADANNTPSSTTAPANPAPAAVPAPPAPRPQRPPTANRARAQGRIPQLRNHLVYQFRQPEDTSINNAAAPAADNNNNNSNNDEDPPAANDNSNNNSNTNNDETSANTNDYTDDVYDDDDDVNAGEDTNSNNNSPTNTEPDNNDSSDNANTNNNGNDNANTAPAAPPPPPNTFNFNAGLPQFQGQFGVGGNFNGPSGFGNFAPSNGFPYNAYNDFNPQYQPSSPTGYSVRYY